MTRLTLLSDTHGRHRDLPAHACPGGDLLVHAGDFTAEGGLAETRDFLAWFAGVGGYRARVLVPGNHDRLLHTQPGLLRELLREAGAGEVTVLIDQGVTLAGLNLWGMPWTPRHGRWAFGADEEELARRSAQIPDDTTLLITHGPPRGVLDRVPGRHLGCAALARRVRGLPELRLHVCGHVHEQGGRLRAGRHLTANAALWDHDRDRLREPLQLELAGRGA